MLKKEERAEWVKRGYKDPRTAFANHIHSASTRGIPFKLTFDEWWSLWADHYAQRGVHKGQRVMCRTADKGAYEVGNVRIATVAENAQERSLEYRSVHGLKKQEDHRIMPPAQTSWLWRGNVFSQYSEDDEGENS